MRIEKRHDADCLIGAPVECDGCDEASEDGEVCCHHLNGEHLAVSYPDSDGVSEILARWPIDPRSEAQRMIDAIRVINNTTFSAGTPPPGDSPEQVGVLYRWTLSAKPGALKLRDYQHHGISSRDVVKALECGALVVRIEGER